MNWMNCVSCQRVVQVNNTMMCLGCQRGFQGTPQEDSYEFHHKKNTVTSLKTTKSLEERKQEIENAIKERQEPENNKLEHQGTQEQRIQTKPSRRHKSKRSKKK